MIPDPLMQKALGKGREVSMLGMSRLHKFCDLVQKWNPSINIVAKSSLEDIWNRHVIDSVQTFGRTRQEHKVWLDIGSGGGFPGMIIAILAAEFSPTLKVVLVESDKRKAVFLSEVGRQIGLSITVHAQRIENLPSQRACVISARALAPLSRLCDLAAPHLGEDGICVFPKGANHLAEILEARRNWHFELDQQESVTDEHAAVLYLQGLKHV